MDDHLWLHEDVLNGIEGRPHLGKRLGIALQQIAALGRTTIVKGCSDISNRGWLRTPLGGASGMHYYLWWTREGSAQCKSMEPGPNGSIFLRTVRHHDNHKPLRAGRRADYHQLTASDLGDEASGSFETPWTEAQEQFTLDDGAIRVVHGYPGSGKTMALWRAIESREGNKTLYLSWSRALVEQAQSRFKAFVSPGSMVDARDFSTFLGILCGEDVTHLTLDKSRESFSRAYPWWKVRQQLGRWHGKLDALHGELRAVLFGCAVPEMFECSDEGSRLSDETYLCGGISEVGPEAARSLLKTIKQAQWASWFGDVFPELAAAHAALSRLREAGAPSGFLDYDRIVVDEVQDLTLLETAVVLRLCRALAMQRSHAPWLLMAFDDGQTVRPSGFNTGRLNDLLGRWLAKPAEFGLEYNVRSPSAIADVVRRASALYKNIDKGARPTDQRNESVEHEIDARLIYVPVPSQEAAIALLRNLDDIGDVAVIAPNASVPTWVPVESAATVLTPDSAKGLEYASVCVLDPGAALERLNRSNEALDPLELHEQRTMIDRLRVALSRATENLAFVDVRPDASKRKSSMDLLLDAEIFEAEDLVELFRDSDAPPEQRILTRVQDARSLLDTSPERAWQRARQAIRVLGKPGQEATVEDEAVQAEARSTVLTVAARRLVSGGPKLRDRNEVVETVERVVRQWGDQSTASAFEQFESWTRRPRGHPIAMLNALQGLADQDRDAIQSALPSMLQALLAALQASSQRVSSAAYFSGNVEGWLRSIGFVGDLQKKARDLRIEAFDTLIGKKKVREAGLVLELVESPEPGRKGLLYEKQGRSADAAVEYEKAGLADDALRTWRQAGEWARALAHAKGQEKADLTWLVSAEKTAYRRPDGIQDRMTPKERRKLSKLTKLPAARKKAPPPSPDQQTLFGESL